MKNHHPINVDHYLKDGCGRCSLYATDACKARKWNSLMWPLRKILLDAPLYEIIKWGVPCYTYEGQNILLLSAFKEYVCMSFFKGALLQDKSQKLTFPGPNSQSSKQWRFTSLQQITSEEATIQAYVQEAIEIEKNKQKVIFKKSLDPYPEEFLDILSKNQELKDAFAALSMGRKRGYLLHFSGAKQSSTKLSRIVKCIPLILEGKGLHD